MGFCVICGNELNSQASYCGRCGRYTKELSGKRLPVLMRESYCGRCGAKIKQQYCSECGTAAIHIDWKEEKRQEKPVEAGMERADGRDTDKIAIWFRKLCCKTLWKKLLEGGALFAVILNVLSMFAGMVVEAVMKSEMAGQGIDADTIQDSIRYLRLKGNLLRVLYGMNMDLRIRMEVIHANVQIKLMYPWFLIGFLVIFIGVAQWMRRRIMKVETSVPVMLMNSAMNGLITTILLNMLLWNHKAPQGMINARAIFGRSGVVTMGHGGIGLYSIVYVAIVSFAIQLLLPKIKTQTIEGKNVIGTMKELFGVLWTASFIGGIGVILVMKQCYDIRDFKTLLIGLFLGIGGFISVVTTGGLTIFQVVSKEAEYSFKLGWFHMTFEDGIRTLQFDNPLNLMQIILMLLTFWMLVQTAGRYFKERRISWKQAVKEVTALSGGLALLTTCAAKTFVFVFSETGPRLGIHSPGMHFRGVVSFGNSSIMEFWLVQFVYFTLVFLGVYFIQWHMKGLYHKITVLSAKTVKVIVIIGTILVIGIRGVTFSQQDIQPFEREQDNMDMEEFMFEMRSLEEIIQEEFGYVFSNPNK